MGENFLGLLAGATKRCHAPQFHGENFAIKLCDGFLPQKFPCYTVPGLVNYTETKRLCVVL